MIYFQKPIETGHEDAYKYLTDWMYQWREPVMHSIANIYRNADPNVKIAARIEITNMVSFYKGLKHQKRAMEELKTQFNALPQDVREHFEKLYQGKDADGGKNIYEYERVVWQGAPRPEYESQMDNPILGGLKPWNTCNCSATAMMMRSLELKGVKFKNGQAPLDSEIVRWVYCAGFDSSTDHAMLNNILYQKTGADFDFKYGASYKDLDEELLENGNPVVLGILHKGHWSSAYGGHMIEIHGKVLTIDGQETEENLYIGHDPFGEPPTYTNYNGQDVLYDVKKTLEGRWQVFGSSDGWMRVFRGVS